MDADALHKVAHEEISAAFARYLARVGDEPEVFGAAICEWLAEWFWFVSALTPEAPRDADASRKWEETLKRAKADLELRRGQADSE